MEDIFPDKATILKHKEVLKFACCLSDKPDVLIEIICDRFANQVTEHHYLASDYRLLWELTAELSTTAHTVQPLRNQFINYFYFDRLDRQEEQPVFVPSKMFKGIRGGLQVILFSDNYTRLPAIGETTETRT